MGIHELARLASDLPISDTGTHVADLAQPEGKTGCINTRKRQKSRYRDSNDDDFGSLRAMRDRTASAALLGLLKRHHDFNVPKPDPVASFPKKKIVRKVYFKPPTNDPAPHIPTLADIRRAVCDYFQLDYIEFISDRRDQKIVYPRQIAFYLGKTLTPISLPRIGQQYGGKDHTTVLHGVRKIESQVKIDWRVAYDVAAVEGYL